MPITTRLPDLEHWKAQVKCQAGCPVSTDAGRYVQLIAEGREEEAYLVARAPNPFASVCGRVCAAPCEDACRRGAIDAPIAIRALKRYVTERYGVESLRPDTQDRLRDVPIAEGNRYAGHLPIDPGTNARPPQRARRKVAVVGAGPSGMSAAHDLALLGHDVTVFEAAPEPGGMMRFGIPEYRLPRALIRAEIEKIVSLGVILRLGTPLSPAFGLAELARAGVRGRVPVRRRLQGARPRHPGCRAGRRHQGRRLPPEREPGLPHEPGPARGGHRRGLRGLRRRAHRAAPGARERGRPRVPRLRIGLPGQGSARLRPRRPARRRHRRDHRLPRALRRDARAAHHPGARGVRRDEAGGRRVPSPPRPQALPGRRTPHRRRAAPRASPSSTRAAASLPPTTTKTSSPSRPTPASWPSARSPTSPS